MYEVSYITTRVARVDGADREAAKRNFAAYVLYDDCEYIVSDVQLSFGDESTLTPDAGAAPTAGSRADMRAWLARRDAESEPFEPGVYEDPERTIDTYLRLLANNDPWRLEGHGSLGRTLSAVRAFADLVTFDRRVRYRFDATQFLDYVRADTITSLDPRAPHDSVDTSALVDVSALHDGALRQIASSYATIVRERALTATYANGAHAEAPFTVVFEPLSWRQYLAHRLAEPERFLPPPGWMSAFDTYDER